MAAGHGARRGGAARSRSSGRRGAGPYPAAGARPRRAARAAAILGTASEGSGAGSIATARQEGPAAPEAPAPPWPGRGRLLVRVTPSRPRGRDGLWDGGASLRHRGNYISALPREGPRLSRGGAVTGARRALPPPPCLCGGAVRRCLRAPRSLPLLAPTPPAHRDRRTILLLRGRWFPSAGARSLQPCSPRVRRLRRLERPRPDPRRWRAERPLRSPLGACMEE